MALKAAVKAVSPVTGVHIQCVLTKIRFKNQRGGVLVVFPDTVVVVWLVVVVVVVVEVVKSVPSEHSPPFT